MTHTQFTLYGMQISWYTAKLRPYLKFKGIPYQEQVPSLYTYYHRINKACGNPTLPVLVTPEGEWLQDSSIIIERMEQRYPEAPVVPATPLQKFAASLIELWGDEFWHSAAMHTRWSYFPQNYDFWENEAMQAFAPGMPRAIQKRIALVPAKQMLAHLPRLGATPEQNPQIERWTETQLDVLNAHFAVHPFLFGTRPSIADFGLIGPIQGHLDKDVRSRRVYLEPRTHLCAWIDRMVAPALRQGKFLGNDEIPETLLPLLRSVFDEMVPYMAGIVRDVDACLPTMAAGERLPRFCGEVEFPFAGAPFKRLGMPYTLWMCQRVLDQLQQMPATDADTVRRWLQRHGGTALLQMDIPRLRRVGLQTAPEWPLLD